MTTQVYSELFADTTIRPTIELGQLVEVTYTSPPKENRPTYSRVMHFLGTVAARPEDKTNEPVYTERRGGVKFLDIQIAGTYTIKTLAQTMTEREQLPDGRFHVEQTVINPADLILDISNDLYRMNLVETSIPQPR